MCFPAKRSFWPLKEKFGFRECYRYTPLMLRFSKLMKIYSILCLCSRSISCIKLGGFAIEWNFFKSLGDKILFPVDRVLELAGASLKQVCVLVHTCNSTVCIELGNAIIRQFNYQHQVPHMQEENKLKKNRNSCKTWCVFVWVFMSFM